MNISKAGWNYGSLADPANGKQRLVSVTRLSDNAAIATDNVWQTPCTLRDGKDPVHENRLHFVFELQEEGETYLLSFEQRPDVELQVERFKGGPGENEILEQQLKEISVLFNKPIDASTFTYDDITLTCQGVKQDVSKIGISSISSTEYKLILEPLTNKNGYFVLTVYTDDIIDSEGPDFDAFTEALFEVNRTLAKMMAGDGEGANALFEVKVVGADNVANAKTLAKSVVTSSPA